MAKPVVLVKLSVEPSPVPSTDRGDAQPRDPRISHPPHVASPTQDTPIHSQPPKSQPCTPDYEKAVQVSGAVLGQVGPLADVAAEEPVAVLVGRALPG